MYIVFYFKFLVLLFMLMLLFYKYKLNRILGGMFLIAGTSIGAGMIGLPLKTLGINFYLILVVFFIVWFVMLITALAMLEISLWVKDDKNIITICKEILGIHFSYIVCIIYLLFLYALLTAYISGIVTMFYNLININICKKNIVYNLFVNFIFILPFFIIIFNGILVSDYINRICVILLIILYIYIIYNIPNKSIIIFNKVSFSEYKLTLSIFPILITSFGYHLLIPSLKTYLYGNSRLLYITIILGSLIPFIMYIIWEYVMTIMLIKIDCNFLSQEFSNIDIFTKYLIIIMNNNYNLFFSVSLFSFFAISSSLIGVSLGLFDFFLDLFNFSRKSFLHRICILFLIFIIPLFLSVFLSNSFIFILGHAGIFASLLLILIPSIILWYGRYNKKINFPYILFGGRITLCGVIIFGIIVIIAELY